MHPLTVTALLAALVCRRRNAGGNALPSFPGVMETIHVLPGRLRLRAPVLIGHRAAAEQLGRSLERVEGVRAVEVSPISGSLLFRFAAAEVTPDLLMGAAIRLLGLERDVLRPPPSYVGQGVRSAGQSLNHAILQQSGGAMDLWTSVSLLLAAAGVRQLVAGDPLAWPLLWWSYSSLFPPQQGQ